LSAVDAPPSSPNESEPQRIGSNQKSGDNHEKAAFDSAKIWVGVPDFADRCLMQCLTPELSGGEAVRLERKVRRI